MFIDIKKIIKTILELNRTVIYKHQSTHEVWQGLLDFDDVVKHNNKEYEIIIDDDETLFEIFETIDLEDDFDDKYEYDHLIDEYESDDDSDYTFE